MGKSLLLAAGLCALAAPALASPTCLSVGQVYNWKVVNDRTLIVEDEFHNRFRMDLLGPCPQLNFKERVGFKSVGGFSQLSCLGAGDHIFIRNFGTGPQICPIKSVVPYTPDMEKADKAAEAAKQNTPPAQ
ncbi:MAG TPA: DUF6491 family protein [Rhizomicrobium sp.]|nr:DUF6491 family protein [Rhizomicrobium sp.]